MGVYDECCYLQCGECKYFQVDADRRKETTCKRLDHKKYKLAMPWFKSYDCGQFNSNICADFKPADYCKWLNAHWTNMEEYIAEFEKEERQSFFAGKYTTLILDGNKDVRYRVSRVDYFYNRFINTDGSLKWVDRYYYKRSRKSPTGYEVVWEKNNE